MIQILKYRLIEISNYRWIWKIRFLGDRSLWDDRDRAEILHNRDKKRGTVPSRSFIVSIKGTNSWFCYKNTFYVFRRFLYFISLLSKVIRYGNQETLTTEHLPSVPYYLKCQTSYDFYQNIWSKTKEKLVFISPSAAKSNKKGKPNDKKDKKPIENGDNKEKSALLENEEKKKITKEDAKESDLPNEGSLVSQRSIVSAMLKCYWKPVLVGAAFKVTFDNLNF